MNYPAVIKVSVVNDKLPATIKIGNEVFKVKDN